MSVKVVYIWECELCARHTSIVNYADPWDDPVIAPPDGWVSDLFVPEKDREHPVEDIAIACPLCKINPDWSGYRKCRRLWNE